MSELVFLLEEPSAEAMLEGILPRMLPPSVSYRCIVFEGKQDLEAQMVRRMRLYRVPGARFIVLRDKDSGDCRIAKARLVAKCAEAQKPEAVVRIACHELESWYLADLAAVEAGLGMSGLTRLQGKNPYRAPDTLGSPSRKLRDIAPGYQKIGGSRLIGQHLDLGNTRSRSFHNFVKAIQRLAPPPVLREKTPQGRQFEGGRPGPTTG